MWGAQGCPERVRVPHLGLSHGPPGLQREGRVPHRSLHSQAQVQRQAGSAHSPRDTCTHPAPLRFPRRDERPAQAPPLACTSLSLHARSLSSKPHQSS